MFRSILFLTLLGFLNSAPGESKWNPRIYNGSRSQEPGVVRLERHELGNIRPKSFFVCTASLIKPQVILTAAHCFRSGYLSKVRYGCFENSDPNCKYVDVIDHINHPKFVLRKDRIISFGDVAIGKLEYKIENIKPIALPTGRNMYWTPSGLALAVGYGGTEKGNSSECQHSTHFHIPEEYYIESSLIIVHNLDSGTRPGDSGGPLIINGIIYGVLSGGEMKLKGTHVSLASSYSNVNYFRKFIEASIQDLERIKPSMISNWQ